MSPGSRALLCLAAVFLSLATGLGAYASHALPRVLDAQSLRSFEIAVDYQFFHALGLLALAILVERYPRNRAYLLSAALLVAGIVLFCGGLYVSAFDGPALLAGAAPAGGICFILGWLVCAFGVWRARG